MAYDTAILLSAIGASFVLAYLAVKFDERYKPIKILMLFGALFLILSSMNQSIEVLNLQDDNVTINCTDSNASTACTAYNDLITVNTGSYNIFVWLVGAVLLFYFIYFIWDMFLAIKIKKKLEKEQ